MAALLVSFVAATALAHDTGFGHSRRTIFIAPSDSGFVLEYRIQLSADEAMIELTHMDRDRDGRVSADERDAFLTARGEALAADIEIEREDGDSVDLRRINFRLGPTLTQTFVYRLATDAVELTVTDRNFAHKPGLVRLIVGKGGRLERLDEADLSHASKIRVRVTRAPGS